MNTNVESTVSTRLRPEKRNGRNQWHPKLAHKPTSVLSQLSDTNPDVQDEGWGRLLNFAKDAGPDSNPHAWENLTKVMLAQFPKLRPEIAGRMIEIAAAKIKEVRGVFGLQREHDRRREVLRKFCAGIVSSCEEFLTGNPEELGRERIVDVLIMLFATLDTCLRCDDGDIAARATSYRSKFGRGPGKHLPNLVEGILRRRGIVKETIHGRRQASMT